jgi:hypothetical protein
VLRMAPHHHNPPELRREHYARRNQFRRESILPVGAALVIIVLVSLGLWSVILWAISPSVSALLE